MTLVDLSQPIYPAMPSVHYRPPVEFHPLKPMADGDPPNISDVRLWTHAECRFAVADQSLFGTRVQDHHVGVGDSVVARFAPGAAVRVRL